MGRTTTALRTGMRWAQPVAKTVARSQRTSRNAGENVVIPIAEHDVAVRLATEFGARVGMPGPADLVIAIAQPGADNAALATQVGDHRRRGGSALVVVVGNAAERRALERELRTDPDVGIAVMLFVDSLAGDDVVRIRRRVADMVIDHRNGTRRSYAGLQPDVARQMERRLAMRLAMRSVLVASPEKTAAAMKSSHTKLAAEAGSMSQAGVDPKSVGLVVALAMLSPVWRHGAGRLTRFVPFNRILVRSGAVYLITRLVGMAVKQIAVQDREPRQEER
jgi:hypothetical protein